jgi:hypothetical protein
MPIFNILAVVVAPLSSYNRDLTILERQRDGNGYQYNKSLKRIEKLQYMNNLDIVPVV